MDEFGPILNKIIAVVIGGIAIQLVLHLFSAGVNYKMIGYRLKKVEELSEKTKGSMYEHIEKNADEHRDFDNRIVVMETKGETQ